MNHRPLTVAALAAALSFPVLAVAQDSPQVQAPRSTVPVVEGAKYRDNMTLVGLADFLRGHPSRAADGHVHAIVEIPTGTNEKWEVKLDGTMRWDVKNGAVRVVHYLGYPGNYGIVPRAILGKEIGGDGDPLDIVVLGPAARRGELLKVRPVGVIRLIDAGEKDDKVLAVAADGPLGDVEDLADIEKRFVGITTILQTWFENYKGPGLLQCKGFGDRKEAERLVEMAEKSYLVEERSREK
ncbi:MAG: inorganic diphosphatase [Planctomycetes bacterium]|nr:inorganic diphosphatase [Planctomycetota bacterium]